MVLRGLVAAGDLYVVRRLLPVLRVTAEAPRDARLRLRNAEGDAVVLERELRDGDGHCTGLYPP